MRPIRLLDIVAPFRGGGPQSDGNGETGLIRLKKLFLSFLVEILQGTGKAADLNGAGSQVSKFHFHRGHRLLPDTPANQPDYLGGFSIDFIRNRFDG